MSDFQSERADSGTDLPAGAEAAASSEGDELVVDSGPIDRAVETGSGPSSPALASAMQELDRLAELDVADHPDVYQRIHGELQDALTSIDDA